MRFFKSLYSHIFSAWIPNNLGFHVIECFKGKANTSKFLLITFGIVFYSVSALSIAASMDSPGNIFIREKISDLVAFKKAFQDQTPKLKAQSFLAYSLHRDLKEKNVIILTLKCSNLSKGVEFVQSPEFMAAMEKAGAKIPVVWYGLDEEERTYGVQQKATGGIVIARNEVRDYGFWLKCFQAENHKHPDRKYKNSAYSVHYFSGKPAVAIVVHEASDVSKAPSFMTSDAMNGEMISTGVVGLEIWCGINLEEGIF